MNKFDTIVESILSEDKDDLNRKAIKAARETLKQLGADYDRFEFDVDNELANLIWQMEEYEDMTINTWSILNDDEFVKWFVDDIKKNFKSKGDAWQDGNWMWGLNGEDLPAKIKNKYIKQSGTAYSYKEALEILIDNGGAQKAISELERSGSAIFNKDGFEFGLGYDGKWVHLVQVTNDKETKLAKARISSDLIKLFKKAAK